MFIGLSQSPKQSSSKLDSKFSQLKVRSVSQHRDEIFDFSKRYFIEEYSFTRIFMMNMNVNQERPVRSDQNR